MIDPYIKKRGPAIFESICIEVIHSHTPHIKEKKGGIKEKFFFFYYHHHHQGHKQTIQRCILKQLERRDGHQMGWLEASFWVISRIKGSGGSVVIPYMNSDMASHVGLHTESSAAIEVGTYVRFFTGVRVYVDS